MKRLILVVSCALIVALAILSCDRTSTDSVDATLVTEKFKGANYFPNNVGTEWIYQVHDVLTGTYDTVTVLIVAEDVWQSLDVTVWEYWWRDRVDTQFVAADEDAISFYYKEFSLPVAKYNLPLVHGDSWVYPHCFGLATASVFYVDTCPAQAGDFERCFEYYTHVEGVAWDDDSYYNGWLAPNVGLVYGSRSEEFNYSMISKDIWVLLEYKRATGPR
ncbi:MAG: hypothetical protein JSU74_10245 [Candidatus Zixiibacteriota bacterium]|nr:MAG: hypothetical protein JSU74_10245 [candidate division Zixibacteria bacterium]